MAPRDEYCLIQRVLDGQNELFRVLVDRYQLPLFHFVGSLVMDQHQCEDIAQDVFMTAFRNLSRYDPAQAKFSTWLFTIARNQCLNWLKRKRPVVQESFDAVEAPLSMRPASAEDVFSQLDLALRRLPPEQRAAFVLAEIEELPYEEIALIEQVPLGTVKSRISRAKNKLQATLTKTMEHS